MASDSEKEELKKRAIKFEEIWREQKAAHDLIVGLCQSKNIKMTLKQEGKSGHCEIPELWTLEKSVPVNDEEIRAIKAAEGLFVDLKTDENGIVRAEKFTRSGGWTVYEPEK